MVWSLESASNEFHQFIYVLVIGGIEKIARGLKFVDASFGQGAHIKGPVALNSRARSCQFFQTSALAGELDPGVECWLLKGAPSCPG